MLLNFYARKRSFDGVVCDYKCLIPAVVASLFEDIVKDVFEELNPGKLDIFDHVIEAPP